MVDFSKNKYFNTVLYFIFFSFPIRTTAAVQVVLIVLIHIDPAFPFQKKSWFLIDRRFLPPTTLRSGIRWLLQVQYIHIYLCFFFFCLSFYAIPFHQRAEILSGSPLFKYAQSVGSTPSTYSILCRDGSGTDRAVMHSAVIALRGDNMSSNLCVMKLLESTGSLPVSESDHLFSLQYPPSLSDQFQLKYTFY